MKKSITRHHISFINPRTGEREHVWFRTKRSRQGYITSLQQDFGYVALDEWETVEEDITA